MPPKLHSFLSTGSKTGSRSGRSGAEIQNVSQEVESQAKAWSYKQRSGPAMVQGGSSETGEGKQDEQAGSLLRWRCSGRDGGLKGG